MDIYADAIRDVAPAEKLRLVERIWDDLASQDAAILLPDWAVSEAARRRHEMLTDPELGATHDEVWKRINESRPG